MTHAISNHFGASWSIIELHRRLGLVEPLIFKKIDNNLLERGVLERFPNLRNSLVDIQEGNKFSVPLGKV